MHSYAFIHSPIVELGNNTSPSPAFIKAQLNQNYGVHAEKINELKKK